jgi:hypothetical protein
VLPGKKYSSREIAAILLRRRWFVFLPFAAGLAAISTADSRVTSVAGPVGGLLIGVALVAVLEYKDLCFSREEDAARVLMLPVLGMVPVMMSEREQHSRRLRRAAGDVIGYVVVLSAMAVFLWSLRL